MVPTQRAISQLPASATRSARSSSRYDRTRSRAVSITTPDDRVAAPAVSSPGRLAKAPSLARYPTIAHSLVDERPPAVGQRLTEIDGLARRCLQRGRVGGDAPGDARGAERRPVDPLPRRPARGRVRGAMVRRPPGRDRGGCVRDQGRMDRRSGPSPYRPLRERLAD